MARRNEKPGPKDLLEIVSLESPRKTRQTPSPLGLEPLRAPPKRQIKKTFRNEATFHIMTQTQHMTKAATKQKSAPFARVFLLSPARLGGPRTGMLLREEASFETAVKLRAGTATVGEIYSFISGLYFRGKVAYTEAFGKSPEEFRERQ